MRKKKLKRKRRRVGLILTLLILIFSVLGIDLYRYLDHSKCPECLKEQEPLKEKPTPETNRLSLVMVGDALIHDDIYEEAKKNGNGATYDFKPMLKEIKPIVSTYDLAYYNQETILGGSELGLSSYPAFNSPYEVGDAMLDAGFNVISLATNHTLDRGKQAILNSRTYWDQKENVLAVGSYASREDRDVVRIMEKNKITYTMLNYTYGTNGIKVPSGEEYLVNIWPVTSTDPNSDSTYQNYKTQVKKDIDAVRDKVDVLIVAMHWGIEYQTLPNNYQKDMATYLESLGVDIIIGTHPHVIQPITWLNDTLVIYSLGNFISAHETIDIGNRVGLMSMIEIEKKDNPDRKPQITLQNLKNELLYTYYTKEYHDFLVVPFSKMNEQYLSNYQEVYQQYKNIVQTFDQTIEVAPIQN